jgi:hypothetical protein
MFDIRNNIKNKIFRIRKFSLKLLIIKLILRLKLSPGVTLGCQSDFPVGEMKYSIGTFTHKEPILRSHIWVSGQAPTGDDGTKYLSRVQHRADK